MAIVDNIEWVQLDCLVETQQRNRERYSPAISLFRWWARRPHAVAGAILDAAKTEFGVASFLVADPFSGGGTVAFEAVRRGLPTYAQDLYPWPTAGLATSLSRADAGKLALAGEELLEKLSPHRARYQWSDGRRTRELTHIIRVRVAPCRHCRAPIHLFREPFLSMASRKQDEKTAFFGCAACGAVTLRAEGVHRFRCDSCRRLSAVTKSEGPSQQPTIRCPHCGRSTELALLLDSIPSWKPVLVQEREVAAAGRTLPTLRAAAKGDPVQDVAEAPCERALQVAIMPGVETAHLLRHGFRCWGDLYPHRQAQVLLAALDAVEALGFPRAVKCRLRLAVLGATEMAGYLCRWSRTHPKAFEAVANHRYSRSTVVVETNLLSPVGRGTFPRRLRAAEKGLKWLQEEPLPERIIVCNGSARRRRLQKGAMVVTGSSARQVLGNGTAQLVLTDPPYHDDLQYGELSRLFHVWLGVALATAPPAENVEAVPNLVRGTDTERYEDIVSECFRESLRTLAPDGRLVLTFHNHDLAAWTALRNALVRSGFCVVGLATVSAENSADHGKRNRRTFLCDLVIECVRRPARGAAGALSVKGRADTEQRRNLLAIGRALAETVNGQLSCSLKERYEEHLGRMGEDEKLIR
jgi:putative DNA methylase